MKDSFAVGEVVKLCNLPPFLAEHNGKEVTITGPLAERVIRNFLGISVTIPSYMVEVFGEEGPVHPMHLKKKDDDKKPDASLRDTPVRWEDCAWQPRKLETA